MEVQPEGLSGDAARLHTLAGELGRIKSALEREIAAGQGWERNDDVGRQLAQSLKPNSDVTIELFNKVLTQVSGTAGEVEQTGRLVAEIDGGAGPSA
ncbi:hypothetical protein ABZ897_26985 [Nonomuraea sp. NPDC046802]|uniref:hypothetical protein n=1 Tax=Nonomuraea sp. NPDC046802 TaxID=3154919 RepID=UPI0033D973CA